ncbi:hypothetical protein BSKO_08300 [Bryopsis sp. KO-2023]|nr:hypothetical protein BSKO_08300 [Bryopsis sp. KO-2023]
MDATQFLEELEPLPPNKRVSRVVEIGKRSLTEPDLQALLKNLETDHGNYGKLLALWSTYGSRDADLVLRCLSCHSKKIQNLVLKVYPLVVSEDDVLQYLRSLASKTSRNDVSFRFVKRLCELKRRGVLDQYVEETLGDENETIRAQGFRVLSFCSKDVVKKHLNVWNWYNVRRWLPQIASKHPELCANLILKGLENKNLRPSVYEIAESSRPVVRSIIRQCPQEALKVFKKLRYDDRTALSWFTLRKHLPSEYFELLCEPPQKPKPWRTGPEADTHHKIRMLSGRRAFEKSSLRSRRSSRTRRTWTGELAKCSPDLTTEQRLRMCLLCGVQPFQILRRIDPDARRQLFNAWKEWRKSKFEAVSAFDASIPKHLHSYFQSLLSSIVAWDPFISKGVLEILPEDIQDEAQLIFDGLGESVPPELKKTPNIHLDKAGLERRTAEQLSEVFHKFPEAFVCNVQSLKLLSDQLKEEAFEFWLKSRDKCLELCNQLLDGVILNGGMVGKFVGLLDKDKFFGVDLDTVLAALPLERREEFFIRIYDFFSLSPDKRRAKYELLPVAARQTRVAKFIDEEQEKNKNLIQDPSPLSSLIVLLPWDDMISKFEPMLRSSVVYTRSSAIQQVVSSGKHYPENLMKILQFMKKRGREQDQVRSQMMCELRNILPEEPGKEILKELEPEILKELEQIFQASLNAADFSLESKSNVLRILYKIFFVHHEWSAVWIIKVLKRTTFRGSEGFLEEYMAWELENGRELVDVLRKVIPSLISIIKVCIETQTNPSPWIRDLVAVYAERDDEWEVTDEEKKEIRHEVLAEIWDIVVDWLDRGYRETPMEYPDEVLVDLCKERPDLFEGRLPGVMQAFKDNNISEHDVERACTHLLKWDDTFDTFDIVVKTLKMAIDLEWVALVKELVNLLAYEKPKKFSKFVPELVEIDPSMLTRFVVVEALCKDHMNILTKYLGVLNPPRGLLMNDDIWSLGALDKARFYYSSWTPAQQKELSKTLLSIIFDETIAVSKQIKVLRHLAGMPCNSAELCRLAELPDVDKTLLTETALRLLSKVDDPEEGKEALLKALGDSRSNIAATALRSFLDKLTIDEALQQLDTYPFEKVGVAKEVVRILDGYSDHSAAYERLVQLTEKDLHRSVQIVVLEVLRKYFSRPNFPWSYLMKAADSNDVEIVGNALPPLSDRGSIKNLAEIDAKLIEILLKLFEHPLSKVRVNAISSAGRASPKLVDPEMTVMKRLVAMLDKALVEDLYKEEKEEKITEASAASDTLRSMNEQKLREMRGVKVKERK